ncbi:MAG: ABC transporter substrate-binding protein [Bacteroidota bacterium]
MRIVSLLPAATDWLVAFGAAGSVVGRSHECDAPEVAGAPVVSRPTVPTEGDSAAIDAVVQGTLSEGLSLYDVDLGALRALAPDLVVTQAQCAVCAVDLPTLERTLADWTDGQPALFSMEPMTYKQVLDAALRLGRAAGRLPGAMPAVAEGEVRLKRLQDRLGLSRRDDPEDYPAVACVEWIEPLMTAGHWTPDLVRLAGGRAVCAEAGAPSQYVDWHALVEADPDVIAVTACGLTVDQALADLHYLTERPAWTSLRAVRDGRVFAFDGNAYFNRPGPGLVRSVELLAAALHGDRAGIEAEAWEMASASGQRTAGSEQKAGMLPS